MGKIKKMKSRPTATANPLPEFDEFDDAPTDGVGPIEAICAHLQKVDIEEKLNGLHALAVLALRQDKIEEICRSGLVRIAAPLLCDKDEAIRDAAAGAFRNLSVYGTEVCDFLVDNDILTALLSLLNEYDLNKEWVPILNGGTQLDLHADIYLQAINLLRNLCESSSTAVEAFNQTNILNGLLRSMDYTKFGIEISISVAQLLLVISENNSKSWNVLAEDVLLRKLLDINEGSYSLLYLSTLAAGILCNVPAFSSAYTKEVLHSLDKILIIDLQHELIQSKNVIEDMGKQQGPQHLEVTMEINDGETDAPPVNGKTNQDKQSESDSAVNNLVNLINAQRLAAEIITNFGSSEEQSGWDTDNSDESENESVTDYAMEEATNDEENGLPVNFVETLRANNIVQKLWERSQPPNENVKAVFENNSSLEEKFTNMRVSCLLCLQNLSNILAVEDFGGYEAVYNIWVNLGLQVFKGKANLSIMEAITALMRSSLQLLKSRRDLFNQMTESDLKMILNGTYNCSVMEIRVNFNRMLGSLGCLLPEPLVKDIIVFLLNMCDQEEDSWALSESLDALMDVFAVNDWDHIIIELNMSAKIQKLDAIFKSKLRQQRRELKERYAAVQTVKTNFSRFVKYVNEKSSNVVNNVK